MKKNIEALRQNLNPENKIIFDTVIAKNELTIQRFNLLKKDYGNLKNNIKRIEKKRLLIDPELPEYGYAKYIKMNIGKIENKYSAIDYAIGKYKYSQERFNDFFKSKHLDSSTMLQQYKNNLYEADSRINDANDCIRITKRYFKNIKHFFAGHADTMKRNKVREIRLELEQQAKVLEQPTTIPVTDL